MGYDSFKKRAEIRLAPVVKAMMVSVLNGMRMAANTGSIFP